MAEFAKLLSDTLQKSLSDLKDFATDSPVLSQDLQDVTELIVLHLQSIMDLNPQKSQSPSPVIASLDSGFIGSTDLIEVINHCVSLLVTYRVLDLTMVENLRKLMQRVSHHADRKVRMALSKKIKGLYVILDPEFTDSNPITLAEACLKGGARIIQWRDKVRDKGEQLKYCEPLAALCSTYEAVFLVNDHADLAVACGASGLHVGQHDLPIPIARQVLISDQLIGNSNATVGEALKGKEEGVDYIAVGAMFPTLSKNNTRPAGLETLRRVREMVDCPIVAIGGINEENVQQVIKTGADSVAVISAVTKSKDPKEATKRLVGLIDRAQ